MSIACHYIWKINIEYEIDWPTPYTKATFGLYIFYNGCGKILNVYC